MMKFHFLLLLEHVIVRDPTGDLRMITNTKPSRLLSKEPNYREPNTINYSKCKIAIDFSIDNYRSSHRRCSVKNGVLKNFAKFAGKYLCHGLFFNKTLAQIFSCEFCEISKNTFSTKDLGTTASVIVVLGQFPPRKIVPQTLNPTLTLTLTLTNFPQGKLSGYR